MGTYCYQSRRTTTAQFPGGEKDWYKYLSKHVTWPKGVEDSFGKVIAKFFIEKDGRVTNIRIVQHLSAEQDAVAVNVLKASPKWIPAYKDGVAIRSEHTVPINFYLENQ